MRKKIGVFSAQIIEILELDIPAGTPIYYARSMYVLNPKRVKNFIAKGT